MFLSRSCLSAVISIWPCSDPANRRMATTNGIMFVNSPFAAGAGFSPRPQLEGFEYATPEKSELEFEKMDQGTKRTVSSIQTPGMKHRRLTVVTREGSPLDPRQACMRGFGYLISILPVMLGLVWALLDPEHLTWADKVSGTYVKKI